MTTEVENIVVIGSGPAAYSAVLYSLASTPLLFEGEYTESSAPGGQLMTTTDVDNYPGFPTGTKGPSLMDSMRQQAVDQGIRIISRNIVSVTKKDGVFILSDGKKTYMARAVIVATGATAKRLNAPGTNDGEFWQRGISACAVCDGFAFKNKRVAVIGGGDTAMEEALYLSKIATKVYVIHRRNEFRARKDKLDKISAAKNIEILTPTELVSAHGRESLEYLKIINNETNEVSELQLEGLFFGIGHTPNAKFLDGSVELVNGYIKTDRNMATTVPGLFACGDVQDHYYRQAVTAAASGCQAAIACLKYINN